MINKIFYLSLIITFSQIQGCQYKNHAQNPELIVPPFIQEENPDIYKIFTNKD